MSRMCNAMNVVLYVISSHLYILSIVRCQSVSTIPDTDDGPAYIITLEGEVNLTVVCTVFETNQVQTVWRIRRQEEEQTLTQVLFGSNGIPTMPAEFIGDLFATGELISGTADTFLTNFTFLNFTKEFDTTQLQCGNTALGTDRQFFFRYPVSPSVKTNLTTQFVTEGSNITIDLNGGDAKEPFPPMITSIWKFNGQNLSYFSNIVLNDFDVTLNNINRNMSGNYTLTVSNSAGSVFGSVEVKVQYPPEAILVGGSAIFLTGSNVTLIAFLSIIDGNPAPSVSWTGPDGQIITNGGKFNTSILGQITIIEAKNGDNGSYTCTISNGIAPNLFQAVELVFPIPPGLPQNLLKKDVSDTTVNLSWSPPYDLGLPELKLYRVSLYPLPLTDVSLYTTSTSLLVPGLIPSTLYNVTVVGVSTGDNFDILEGEESNQVTFKTLSGAPLFDAVTAFSLNGAIFIQWTLRYTGGLCVDVYSYCDVDEVTAQSSLVSLRLCVHNRFDKNLTSSTELYFVQSGKIYSCNITAVNSEGTDRRSVGNVVSSQGLPSTPIIVSMSLIPGRLALTLRVGIVGASDGSFRFVLEILHANNGTFLRVDTFLFRNYTDDEVVTVNIDIVNGGLFNIVVMAVNSFGSSVQNAIITEIIFERAISTDKASLISMPEDFLGSCTPKLIFEHEMSGIPVTVSAGISAAVFVTLLIALLILISAIFIIFRTRGNKENNKNLRNNPRTMLNRDYEIIEKEYKHPGDSETIDMEQNKAYGEVKPPIYL